MSKITNLKDIAESLNLSISTVSRVINDKPGISKKTKKRVLEKAKQLNYTTNLMARAFRISKSNIIGVIVPTVSLYFTSIVLKGILSEAEKRSYRVMITESNNDVKKEEEMFNALLQFGVDGILISLSKNSTDTDYLFKASSNIPMVMFDKVSSIIPCTRIVINEEEAAYNAVKHLISIGKRKIAILKESKYSYTSEKRYKGYLKALADNNIELEHDYVKSCLDINLERGKELTKELLNLKNLPDAIFAITDSAAVGAIQIIKKSGLRIPEDIAVVGFSNSSLAEVIEPNLTTIDQPGLQIGRTAVNFLIDKINKSDSEIDNKTVEIKTKLIIRNSTVK